MKFKLLFKNTAPFKCTTNRMRNSTKIKAMEIYEWSRKAQFEIVCFVETGLDDRVPADRKVLCPKSYKIARRDRSKLNSERGRGGGVLIATKTNFICENIECDETIEILAQKIQCDSLTMYLVVSYIPPEMKTRETFEKHIAVVTKIKQQSGNNPLILCGDFNMETIQYEPYENYARPTNLREIKKKYLHFVTSLEVIGLFQINTASNGYNRFLDLIFTDMPGSFRILNGTAPNLPVTEKKIHREIIVEFN